MKGCRLLCFILIGVILFAQVALTSEEKVFRVGISEEPTTLNYWAAMGSPDSTMFNLIVQTGYYSSLFGYAESTWAYVPVLANDLPGPITPMDKYYSSTIELQQGIYWSAGIPFTADDVVFTYSTLIDLKLQGNWREFHPDCLVKVEKVDDYKVTFYFNRKPSLAEWNYGILMCPILPISLWGVVVEEAKLQANPAEYLYTYEVTDPVTLGGFDLGKWEAGRYWQNQRADYYTADGRIKIYENGQVELESMEWSWAGVAEEGSLLVGVTEMGPHVDSVRYQVYASQESMVMALKRGDIDYMLSHQGLTKIQRQELEKAQGVEVVSNPSNSWSYLAFNRKRYPFQIEEFHQAVAILIDREYIAEQVLHNTCLPTAFVIPPKNAFWHRPNLPVYGQGMSRVERIQEAMRILEAVGFSWEVRPVVNLEEDIFIPGEGIILPNGEKMRSFEIITSPNSEDPVQAIFGLYIQYWLQDIGIPVESRPRSFSEMTQKVIEEMDFDAYILSWGLDGTYPDFMYQLFATNGGYNTNGFSDPDFDQIISQFMQAKDIDTARKYAFDAQERLAESLPYIILYTAPVYDAYRSDRVEYPFTDTLEGIQGLYGMPAMVKIVE